jgi:hypothetical protein
MTQRINQQDLIGLRGGNLLLNGSMDLWPEGTSFPSITSRYTAEGWTLIRNATSAFTVTRSTDVPDDTAEGALPAAYSMNIACATADAVTDATDFVTLNQRIEGYVFRRARRRTVPCSLWVKTNKTGKYSVSFRNSTGDRSYVRSFTVSQADTWEKKSFVVRFGAEPNGTYDFLNGVGIEMSIALQCGSSLQAAAEDVWENADRRCVSGQVNFSDSTSNYFRVTMVQLDPDGGAYVPFGGSFFAEQNWAMRYFETSYNYGVAPGTVTNAWEGALGGTAFGSGQSMSIPLTFKVPKRAAPGMSFYSPVTGAGGFFRAGGADQQVRIFLGGTVGGLTGVTVETNAAAATNTEYYGHFVANARL